jgi:hypothetical protein
MKNPSTVAAIFVRSKIQPAFTYLWNTIPQSIKTVILDRITFNTYEKPILSFYIRSNKWWLLTTERIILNFNSIENIYLIDIQNVKLNKLFDESIAKLGINTVQLEINNKYFDLEVEKRTWHVIYGMLKFMVHK